MAGGCLLLGNVDKIMKFVIPEKMNKTITIDRRGTITLPRPMRRRLALPDDGGILIAQETADGIPLRPGKVLPAEIYSDEEVADYKRADEELRAILPKLQKPARSPRKG